MKLEFSASFGWDYRRLSRRLQTILEKKLGMFLVNSKHPSLRMRKMEGFAGIYEARFSKGYRFTFQKEDYGYFIRRVGPHDILRNP